MMRVAVAIAALMLAALVLSGASLAAERIGYCGVVKAYTAATQASDGSVTIGSRTVAIAAGTQNQGTHEPTVGQKRCVMGETDAQGRFVVLSVEASLIDSACGEVLAFTPATSANDGSLTLQVAARPPVTYVVPAGTQLPPDTSSGQHCFSLDVNAAGDAIVTGIAPTPPEGGVAGRAPATRPPVAGLPSTSTDPDIGAVLAAAMVFLIFAASLTLGHRKA